MAGSMILELTVLFGVLFICLFLRFPVFLSMSMSIVVYALCFPGSLPLSIIGQGIVSGLTNQNFVAVCFYFFLGEIMSNGGLGDRLVEFLDACIGHIPGSLSHINVLESMVFAGVSGSSVADAASVGSMMINMMKKVGYPAGYAAAITAVTAIIGPVIPPSSGLVLMGIYFGTSVRRLFLAGIIPGILMGVFELVISYYISKKRNFPCTPFRGWKYVWEKTKYGLPACLLPALLMICLVAGIGTVVEVGALSCLVAIILSLAYREITIKQVFKLLMRTTVLSASVLAMISLAGVFTWIVSSMGAASWVASQVTAIGAGPVAVCATCMVMLFLLGLILDVPVIQMVIVPVIVPAVASVGIDPVWFSILCVLVIQVGLNTPPVGSLIYMTAQIADCNAIDVVKEEIPYLLGLLVLIALMIIFPGIVTFLPNLILGVP